METINTFFNVVGVLMLISIVLLVLWLV